MILPVRVTDGTVRSVVGIDKGRSPPPRGECIDPVSPVDVMAPPDWFPNQWLWNSLSIRGPISARPTSSFIRNSLNLPMMILYLLSGGLKMSEEIKVLNVQFLTNARLTLQVDGETKDVLVAIDLVNRKVYDNSKSVTEVEGLGEVVFSHLDTVTAALPGDFFSAGEDIQEKAQQAYDEIQRNREHLGDADGWGSTTN